MKAVFDTRPDTGYDDDITCRYHFPNRYLGEAERALGDWIVYRETSKGGGRNGYVAVARVTRIDADPIRPGHSYAYVADYLEFDTTVRLFHNKQYYETRLKALEDRSHVGRALRGKSIRTIPGEDFVAITNAGLADTLDPASPHGFRGPVDADIRSRATGSIGGTTEEQERLISQHLVNRRFRNAAFRGSVLSAYKFTCAFTRLHIVNGGGRVEAQAAHIKPVADGGPDAVQNGLALSATCHWLFDRHLVSLSDEFELLVAHNRVPRDLQDLFVSQREKISLPDDKRLWPRRDFMAHHRERFASH